MTTWIDITDLMSWSGHFTGIQRVVFNIAYRMQRDNPDVKFFYYDNNTRNFYKHFINLEEWLIVDDQKSKNVDITSKEKILNLIPHNARKMTPKYVKIFAFKTGKYVLGKKSKFSTRKHNKDTSNNVVADFKENDHVLVLGNAWDNENLILDLGQSKRSIKFKLINIVYDLIPIFEPQFFGGMVTKQYTNYLFEAVTNCDLLMPISKSTENDILKFCNKIEAPLPLTKVIRLGDEISNNPNPKKPKWLKDNKFILTVGTIEVRKNHTLLYYAYKKLLSEGIDVPKLIIVGKRGWYTGDTLMLFEQDILVRDKVQIIENTTDDELDWLYGNCLFTVYPSLYEGWGLPVAESLARGKVVLCSSASSIPEVGGDSSDYFSPYNAEELAQLIIKYMNPKTRKQKEKYINSEFMTATWEDSYMGVKDIIS